MDEGTVIGCLRKLQRWNLASILTEYRRFVGNRVRLTNEQVRLIVMKWEEEVVVEYRIWVPVYRVVRC